MCDHWHAFADDPPYLLVEDSDEGERYFCELITGGYAFRLLADDDVQSLLGMCRDCAYGWRQKTMQDSVNSGIERIVRVVGK